MKKNKKKLIIISIIIVVIFIFLVLIYKNVFSKSNDVRYKNIEKYKLTNNEINSVKKQIKEIDEVKKVDVYIDSKIIKIVVKLSEDVDFEKIKTTANDSLTKFSEDNLSYYDVEFFIDSSNDKSEVYPQIGYKFKSNSEFSW